MPEKFHSPAGYFWFRQKSGTAPTSGESPNPGFKSGRQAKVQQGRQAISMIYVKARQAAASGKQTSGKTYKIDYEIDNQQKIQKHK